jgi:hypothetical protein
MIGRRLARSSLAPRSADGVVDLVRSLGGVHAQAQVSAELQLANRLEHPDRAEIRRALWEKRTLAKAWTIRGTLHLHAADELALWLAARRAVSGTVEGLPVWIDPRGVAHPAVGPAETEAARAAVWEALDGRCLTREQLSAEVAPKVSPAVRSRVVSGFAFFLGDLCQGPPQGAKITLARPDQWVAGWREVDPGEALAEVCRRYVDAFAPVRPVDFHEWFGTRTWRVADARELFASLDLPEPEPVPLVHCVRLLSEYDLYVMGFRERDVLIPEPVRVLVAADGRGRYEGPAGVRFVLVDGVAAGLWSRRQKGKRLEIGVTLAQRLTKAQRAELEREAERLAGFLGLTLELSV